MFIDSLEHIYTITDPQASYDFNDIMVARDPSTGKIYVAHDEGCSCPTPWEYINSFSDMEIIFSIKQLRNFIAEHQSKYRDEGTWPQRDVDAMCEVVEKVLDTAYPFFKKD